MKRTRFFSRAALAFALLWTANSYCYAADTDLAEIKAEITKRHDEAVKRLQDWIEQVSIAAENRGYPEGAEYMAKLAKRCGISAGDGDQHRWQAGRVRDTRCGRAEDGRALFHVRREAVRSGGMDVAAAGSAHGGKPDWAR